MKSEPVYVEEKFVFFDFKNKYFFTKVYDIFAYDGTFIIRTSSPTFAYGRWYSEN